MATVKPVLWKHQQNNDGTYTLKIKVTKNRKTRYFPTDIKIADSFWDGNKIKSHQHKTQLNNKLNKLVADAQSKVIKWETENQLITVNEIMEKLKSKVQSTSFISYAESCKNELLERGQIRTHNRYKTIINKLKNYLNNRDLLFSEFTVSFLNKYETYLISIGNKTNTIHTNIKTLRAILYKAIQEGIYPQESNPFFTFKLKKEKTEKPKLSIEQFNKIKALEIEENTLLWHVKNYFVFATYTAGIRIGDLMQLKVKDVNDGRLSYQMDKTGTYKEIALIPQAIEILNLYDFESKPLKAYLFPILKGISDKTPMTETYRLISSKTALINKYLKKLAVQAAIPINLTFHVSRHTWSEIARKKGMNLYDISKALGHSSLSITENYLKELDTTSLDKQMQNLFE